MTNAVERFASEYELFRQDVASGRIDLNNLDSAQARVYNVVKTIDRADITAIESGTGLNGIRLDKENKYPQNQATAKAIMENYMKTSTSTFEPKQSDKSYWYNTLTGYTIVADSDIDTSTLYEHLPVEVRYSNSQPAALNEWVDLSVDFEIPDIEVVYAYQRFNAEQGRRAISIVSDFKKPINEVSYIDNVYIIGSYDGALDESKPFNINTAFVKKCVPEGTAANITKNYTLTDLLEPSVGFYDTNSKIYFRLCYEYNINGETQYTYSPIFSTDYLSLSDKPYNQK